MSKEKKTIAEEIASDFELMESALSENAKEILRAVSREEIKGLMQESLSEEDDDDEYEIEDAESEDEGGDEEVAELPGDEAGEEDIEDTGMEGGEDDFEGGDEGELDIDGEDLDSTEDSEGYEGEEGSEDYEMDMTTASDEDVISVYKKLSNDDEIEVVSSNEVIIKDPVSGSEYNVKLGGGDSMIDKGEMDLEGDFTEEGGDEFAEGEEVFYEVELNEEEETEVSEDIVRGKGHDKELVNTKAPNTGDIEGQKAPQDKDSGDNLDGGFDDDGQNGSGDNHAKHIMEDDSEEVNESDDAIEETKEFPSSAPKALPAKEATGKTGINEEDEDLNEEETLEEEEAIEESIPKGNGEARRVPAKANIGQPVAPGAKHVPGVKGNSVAEVAKKYNALLAEAKKLKDENESFKKALKDFRKLIGEAAVFNSNLTYVTKLFMEHATTSNEKQQILQRFDNEVGTIEESKKLYKKIVSELDNKSITESVANKLESGQTSGQSKQLNETTAYVDPGAARVLDLIRRTSR